MFGQEVTGIYPTPITLFYHLSALFSVNLCFCLLILWLPYLFTDCGNDVVFALETGCVGEFMGKLNCSGQLPSKKKHWVKDCTCCLSHIQYGRCITDTHMRFWHHVKGGLPVSVNCIRANNNTSQGGHVHPCILEGGILCSLCTIVSYLWCLHCRKKISYLIFGTSEERF